MFDKTGRFGHLSVNFAVPKEKVHLFPGLRQQFSIYITLRDGKNKYEGR